MTTSFSIALAGDAARNVEVVATMAVIAFQHISAPGDFAGYEIMTRLELPVCAGGKIFAGPRSAL